MAIASKTSEYAIEQALESIAGAGGKSSLQPVKSSFLQFIRLYKGSKANVTLISGLHVKMSENFFKIGVKMSGNSRDESIPKWLRKIRKFQILKSSSKSACPV